MTTLFALAKDRFRDILLRDRDLFAAIHVSDAALIHSITDGFLDVLAKTLQEALTIDRTLLFTLLAAIDDEECHVESLRLPHPQVPLGQQPDLLFRIAVIGHPQHKVFVLLLILV